MAQRQKIPARVSLWQRDVYKLRRISFIRASGKNLDLSLAGAHSSGFSAITVAQFTATRHDNLDLLVMLISPRCHARGW
jgi:hypothetical protein